MNKVQWSGILGILIMLGLLTACPMRGNQIAKETRDAKQTVVKAGKEAEHESTPAKTNAADTANVIDDLGLVMTKDGIEFSDAECAGAYNSQVSDSVVDNNKRRIAYKITSTCTSNGDSYTWALSEIKYNNFGQRTGYKLKLSASRQKKEYDLIVSDILQDGNWQILSYKVQIGSKVYSFKR